MVLIVMSEGSIYKSTLIYLNVIRDVKVQQNELKQYDENIIQGVSQNS